jgi:hypothetical protein
MSKLFKLKNWLTIDEAARHLSGAFTESVTEADVLRLALDERLKLSVNFVNPVVVKLGTLIKKEDVPYEELVGKNGRKYRAYISAQHVTDDGRIYIFDAKDPAYNLRGVCDIPMGDGIQLEVERRYQIMTGGPELTERWRYGVMVEVVEKDLCQFEMCMDEPEMPDIADVAKTLIEHMAASPLSPAEQFEKIQEALTTMRRTSEYCIVDQLPDESVLVVRRNALTEFISSMSGTPANAEKPLDARERTSYQNIIGALLAQLTAGKANDTTVITQAVTDYGTKYGISERKLQEVFAAAKRSLGAS